MKTINKYFLLAMAGSLLTFAACSDDIEREPSPVVDPDCQGAYFAADNTYAYELDPESPTSITLTVARTNTEAAATIGIEVLTNTENIFEIPESVSFEAGQSEADITLNFPNAEIGASYSYELKLEEGSYNPYVEETLYAAGDVIRIKWNEFDTAIYTDGMVGTVYGVDYPLSWYVNAAWAEFPDGSMRVRVLNPYCEAFNVDDNGIYDGFPYVDATMITNNNVQMIINTNANRTEATMDYFDFGCFLNPDDGNLIGGTAYGIFQGTTDDFPLGEVDYDAEAEQLNSIIFGENSLFASVASLWAQGQAGIAENPTTLFFSLEAWQEYQAENAPAE